MQRKLKVASWNIGGAHTVGSNKTFNYDAEDLEYFADILKTLDADVVCLQESHTNDGRVIAEVLANSLDLEHVFDSPRSPSHIDPRYQLSNAIISRYPIITT